MFDCIAFDADDTLWHNETLYSAAQAKLRQLLSPYADGETVDRTLFQTEMSNLEWYGYGIKSFTLSMIETAVKLSLESIAADQILQIIGFAKEMLATEVQLTEHAQQIVHQLGQSYPLMLITKGDLRDQETKLAQSGLMEDFSYVEIVSQKIPELYRSLLSKYQITPSRFLMVGNSLKSDILPVLEIGAHAVHIPYHLTWEHEMIHQAPTDRNRYHQLQDLRQLPALIEQLERKGKGEADHGA